MSGLTAVSLFAGVGGIDLALERAGVKVTAAVEIDKAARGVIADRLPKTTLFDDVTKVTADELRATGFVPERGILAGGFPCQDLSVAGRRKGLGGSRSGLFWHIMRLADALQPQWLLLENVPGLLSSVCADPDDTPEDTGRGAFELEEEHDLPQGKGPCPGGCMAAHGGAMGTILGALGERGYGFAYRVLDAQFFTVPQRRERVFFVGSLGDARRPVEVLLEPESSGRDHPPRESTRTGAAPLLASSTGCPGGSTPGVADTLRSHPRPGSNSNGAIVVAETASTLQGGGKRGHRVDAESAAGGHLVPVTFQKIIRSGERDADGNLPAEVWALRGRDGGAQLEIGPEGGPYNALRAGDGGSSRQSLIAFAWQAGGKNDASGAFLRDMSPTLPKSQTMAVQTETAVRRLTPVECERLQGFPDNWTATSDGKAQADSARYRQMGNAVAVPCVEWIARRIVSVA